MQTTNAADNRHRLARQVSDNIIADFGKAPLLALFSEKTARAIIDGYVLRLIATWDEMVAITPEKIADLRVDAAATVLFAL